MAEVAQASSPVGRTEGAHLAALYERSRWLDRAVGATTILVAAALFLSTLQTDINGSHDIIMDDAGEFQVVWNTWGVAHPPGYPLINLLGNLFTHLLRLFGVRPALAASLFSLVLGLLTLGLLYRLLLDRTHNPWASAGGMLLLAVSPLFWLNSSIAEVYTLGMLFVVLLLTVALRLEPERPARTIFLIGLILGLAVGHHRLLLFMLVPLVPLLLPAWRAVRPRMLLAALGLFALGFAVYIYLPLVAWAGSPWIYGRSPTTWPGFLDAFLGREYLTQLNLPGSRRALLATLAERPSFVISEIKLVTVVLGLSGLALAAARGWNRQLATGLLLGILAYLTAPISQELLFGTHMLIIVVVLFVAIGWGLLWAQLAENWRWAQVSAGLVGVALVIWIGYTNFSWIRGLTSDPTGRQIIEGMKQVAEPGTPVVELWGPRYFALGYARWASQELPAIQLMMPGVDLAGLPASLSRFYTTQDIFYVVPPSAWQARLGRLHLSSAAYRIVEVSTRPRTSLPSPLRAGAGGAVQMGDAIRLLDHCAFVDASGAVRLTLIWRAERPVPDDYSAFVHVSDKAQIAGPDDIIAYGDRRHPVYGFYPTSHWAPGEVVRDDYLVPLPPGRPPRLVSFGLYTRDPDTGSFHSLGQVAVPLKP